MAIVKRNHILEEAKFVFDEAGEVVDLKVQVNYELFDDVTDVEEARTRKTKSVWASLSTGQKIQANTIGKRLKMIAEAF